ncbi:L-ascorbate metabolism protein UlaG (beta-lactamase superfamily) [Kribbella aluminosa]|uniref:L-ascorbate metabolism protein UlaG (Beta-lactamase superfamily) n=1 Tax=Kribbella aluminosa TaxID=416017 RepID=A0ABS4UU47_9ACTN|nr:MBL fold metallo-hydrolase [Kribbella aluminosa]MBP2355168.1 L-ascorbate metabolism protein UlaG (beta-lactamase superfamily) [Kribbella aluminosa]
MEITHIGGPTAVLNLGGITFLTDPAFDEPRDYQLPGRVMTKLTGPAIPAAELGPVDVVLLSHDEHKDNLDDAGRALLQSVPTVLSTPGAALRIEGVRGLENWEAIELPRPDGGVVTVTGVPALHGPEGAEAVVGFVTGFVLQGEGLPTVYVSGDNASLGHVKEIADRFAPIDVAVLFAGAARTGLLNGDNLTLTSEDSVDAARILGDATIVPVHTEGWTHFSEGPEQFLAAFREAGLEDRVEMLEHGVPKTVA